MCCLHLALMEGLGEELAVPLQDARVVRELIELLDVIVVHISPARCIITDHDVISSQPHTFKGMLWSMQEHHQSPPVMHPNRSCSYTRPGVGFLMEIRLQVFKLYSHIFREWCFE